MNNSNYKEIPVLIIGYSRISAIRKLIKELLELGIMSIYLALDFSTDVSVNDEQVKLVEELIGDKQSRNTRVKVWYRGRNHGVAVGVISALDWFFYFNESGVILEEDLVFNVDFLQFCASALKQYENRERLLMISGNRFDGSSIEPRLAITNYPQIWGWATWRVKWLEIRNLIVSEKKLSLYEIINPRACFFFVGAKRVEVGEIDTWDTPLAYEMSKKGKLCLLPPVNLVSNIGVDCYAAHTIHENFPLNFPLEKLEKFGLPTLNDLMWTRHIENKFLEKFVFKIGVRHLLSPLKLWSENLFRNTHHSKRKSLLTRLNNAENYK